MLTARTLLFNVGLTCETNMNWLGTVAGRIGYAFNNVLLYAKGGFAFANEDYLQSVTGTGVVIALSEDETRTGWMVGAGVEYGFTPNWSFKVEYNYMDFGADVSNLVIPGTGVIFTAADIDQQLHVVKAGINYRFNWGLRSSPATEPSDTNTGSRRAPGLWPGAFDSGSAVALRNGVSFQH